MKRARLIAAVAVMAFTPPTMAAFTELPTAEPVRIFGSNNPAADPFDLTPGNLNPDLTFDLPANLTLLDSRETPFELPDENDPNIFEEVGVFQDAVFRDTDDNKLVFGSRIVMDPNEEGEINDIFRSGFAGFSAAAAWLPATANDLRLFSAARTANSGLPDDDPDPFNADVVALGTDVNVEEGNAMTAWLLIKTDAPGFAVGADAVGLFQGGEEGQPPFLAQLDGFTPVPVPAALPLFMSALGMLGFRSLGRKSRRGLAGILNLLRFRPSGRNAVRGAALRGLAVLTLLFGWSSAHAGFQSLPTAASPGDPVARVTGFNNESVDLILGLKLPDGSATCPCPPPAGFVELDSRSHSVFVEGFNVGTLFDFVFRDTSDDNLVLGARLVLNPVVNGAPNAFEVNDFLRRNNSGFSTALAGWSRAADPDLRMFAAARTAVRFGEGAETFSLDTIKFQTDVNVSEGNPQSGYFFLKTDAPFYTTMANSLSIFQGGEEGQDLLEVSFPGFVATNVNPIPLPAALPMMLGALGILSVSKRVRRRTNA